MVDLGGIKQKAVKELKEQGEGGEVEVKFNSKRLQSQLLEKDERRGYS